MADDKKPELKVGDVVQLVATERGFRGGVMVERGTKFSHTVTAKNGKPRLPKWAQLASIPLKPIVQKNAGDLKPKGAQDAVAQKRADLGNGQGQVNAGTDLV